MITSIEVSCDEQIADFDKSALFSLCDNNNSSDDLKEITKLVLLLFTKIKNYGTRLEVENKDLENRCISLEAKVQDLSKPCVRYSKYEQDIDDFCKKNESSNKVLFDSDADSRSSPPKNIQLEVDIPRIVKSLNADKLPKENKPDTSPIKTPPAKRSDRDTSPIVQKQQRSGKRTKLSLSVNKKYRFDKDDAKVNANLFSELPDALVSGYNEQEPIVKPKNFMENELNATPNDEHITVSDETVLSDSSLIEPSPTPVIKHRRTKKSNPFLDGKYNVFECVNDDSTATSTSVGNAVNQPASSVLFERKNNQDDANKSKWDLKKRRELSNSKYKQTTLSTSFFKKNVDISTLNEFKGGVANDNTLCTVPEDAELTDVNKKFINTSSDKENIPRETCDCDEVMQETVFYGNNTKKKKSTMLSDPSIKVNEIFFPTNKSNDKSKMLKVLRDSSQETIFHEDEIKGKKSPVTAPDTAFQETCFSVDKPNNKFKHDLELNTALQETYFTVQPDSVKNGFESTEKRAFLPVKPSVKTKSDTELDSALQETFFNPAITSTVNQIEPEKKTTPKKSKPLPPPPPSEIKNSFDFLPSPDTPKYKYRRDALRKKADRQKLPGQECPTCLQFYLEDKDKLGETQLAMIRKCSRHRDKYPIYSNTPPGIWNPKFDDTDESD